MAEDFAFRPVVGCGHASDDEEEEAEMILVDCLLFEFNVDEEATAKDANRSSTENIVMLQVRMFRS